MPVISSRRNVVSMFLRGACAILLTASLNFNLHAQAIYGSIVGTVSDQSGAVAPGVLVTATNAGTGQAKTDTTDQSGRYTIQNLQPGTYKIDMDAKGFRRVEQTGIIVTPNTISRADQSLQIGQATEQVNISAAATLLQTDKADTHSEISSKQIREIPLGGQRSYQTLINLTPGSLPASFNNSVTDNPASPLNTHINGGPGQTNTTRIDGASSVNIWLPQYAGYNTSAETVDVVNVVTSAADADQGLAGASSITVVTKSGTNTLHGSAFLFHNDQHLNARNFFLSPSVAKPVGIYNNYGGTLGGPIMKNKLFYFVSFDGTNQKSSANGTYTVPTLDQRNGDFSAYSTLIYDPNTGTPDGKGRIPFPGNKIPAQLISPVALKLQKYYPSPNLQGATSNYAATGGPIVDRDSVDTKINWNRNDKHAIWGKYGRSWATSGGTGIFGVAGGPAPGSDPGKGDTTVQILTIGHTYAISPNLLLDGNIGYQRQVQTVKGNDFGTNFGSVLGIRGLNGPDQRQSGFPYVSFNGYAQFGIPNWMPLFRSDENYTTSTSLSWNKGAHSFRFGFDSVRFHLNHWQPELSDGGPRGSLDFNGQVTALNGGAAPNQFNSYAQFLLGYSNEVQKGEQYILMTGREWQFGGYAQDRWQVSRNLTVSLGLRYEYYPLMTRAGKGIERYDPLTNRVLLGGRGGQPDSVGITTSKKLFAPRAGIAYRLGEKTVIRTGYGLNYDPIPFSRPLRGFYPLTINADTVAPNSFSYASTFAAGIPPVVGPDLSSGSVVLPGNASERSPWGGLLHRGYTQTWNFTVEHKLPLDVVASAGYVGAHSVHLLADRNINAGAPGSGTAGLPYASYGRTVPTNMWDGYLSSSYNSLQVALNKQFSKGLLLKGAYTWSHAIDYTDDDGWASVGWNYAPVFQRNRATAGFDRNQVFQMGWVYELPLGPGKQHLNSGIASKIVGGWQFSGIEALYTGTPFTVSAPGSSLNAPGNIQTADQIGPVQRLGNIGTTGQFYSPASFVPVTAVRFGNTGRNILRNSGVWNTDVSVMRIFPIRERFQFQFRTEMYNLPNTSHFGGVNTGNITSNNFARITSSFGERTIRFAARMQW